MSVGVSTAEKRAKMAAAGEEWPTYPDGTEQLWKRDPKMQAGGFFKSWESAQSHRERGRGRDFSERHIRERVEGGTCGTRGCIEARFQFSSGKFDSCCLTHKAERNARRIHLGNTYLGTTNQYPAPKEAVIAFARGLREESGLWPA